MNRGAWQATVDGVTKSETQLSDSHTHIHTHTHTHTHTNQSWRQAGRSGSLKCCPQELGNLGLWMTKVI